ncbi:Fungal specific transcription factor domain containing protein [Rhypophila decipiens]
MADSAKENSKTLVRGLEKRKACDLCHIKKIKCDAKKPTCTHCSVYGAQCAYTPHIKKRRKEVKIQPSLNLPQENDTAAVPETAPKSYPALPPLNELFPRLEDYFRNLNSTIPMFEQGPFQRMVYGSFSMDGTSATACPLLTAAVYVILALTYQHKATALPPPSLKFTPQDCIIAVEALTSNLEACCHPPPPPTNHDHNSEVSGQTLILESHHSLLGLQVLLGYTIYQLGTPHPGAVSRLSSLVGRIIKLAHRMELNRAETALFHPKTSLQRSRVFWIAYILDRHISMNSHDPPLQQDDDLDVPIPVSTPGYGLVTFTAESGALVSMDFFSARIHLAKIQGVIYQLIYSVRASNQSFESLASNVQIIRGMLAEWLSAFVPGELYPDNLERIVGPSSAVRELIALYFNYMFCLMHTHKVGHHHAEWIARLVGYSQEVVTSGQINGRLAIPMSISNGAVGSDVAGGKVSTTWVSSPGWKELVSTARECARLFRLVARDDGALLWMTTCAYISSALVLVANRLTSAPEQQTHQASNERTFELQADEEDTLIAQAVEYLEKGAAAMPRPNDGQLGRMAAAMGELSCRARLARAKFGLITGAGNGNSISKNSSAVAWLQNEARKSAGFSAIELVQAFTGAEQKTMATRLFSGTLVQG